MAERTPSLWRAERNRVALARLDKARPKLFPAGVYAHALARPFVPPTPRLAVESYWRHHPVRADRLARALAAASGTPPGWSWRLAAPGTDEGLARTFRAPPAPYREKAFNRGPGHCCVCGQPVYRLGWHRDLWNEGQPNRNASWHAACVTAWKLWCAPPDFEQPLKRRQARRCTLTERRLLKTAEVDHRVPLFRVWREHRDLAWPDLLQFWGVPNLQVVNRAAHVAKNSEEAMTRRIVRASRPRDAA